MPSEPNHDPDTPLPEELRKQLAQFQKHLWRIKVLEAVLAGLAGLILSFLIVFALDRLIPTPPWARLTVLLGGTSLFAIFAPLWIRRWVYGHQHEDQLARLISKKFPKLGDRLLGVVELQDQEEKRESLSPELREAAMAHVARQAAKRDMTEALPISRHQKLALVVTGGVLAVIAGFALAPKAGLNSLKRWLMPYSAVERYTFTQLDLSEIPNPYTVAYGEPFTLEIPLATRSDNAPDFAVARYGSQAWLNTPLSEGSYQFEFPGQQIPDILTLKAGDAIHRIKVEPQIRPELVDLKARVQLPAYLKQSDREIDIRTGILSVLEGSKVTLDGAFTRALASAQGVLTELPSEDEEETNQSETSPLASTNLSFSFDQESLTSAPFEVDKKRAELPITWTDIKGLKGASRFLLRVEPAQDQKPNAYLQGIERQVVILEDETLEFEVLCEDDFGLREIGLVWNGQFTKPTNAKPATGEMILKAGSPTTSRLSDLAVFSPRAHSIPPQKLLLRAYTQDYKPGRERQLSQPVTVYILTPDEHAQMLKNKFDRIIGEMEDAARREQNNLDANERLDQKAAEELQQEPNKRKLAESSEKEKENTGKMEELTKKMEELFKDAARNKDLDPKAMKKLSEALENMRELSEQDMPEISEKLDESQNQKNTAEKSKKDLQKAIEKQKEAIEKMQKTIEDANEANQNFEASTFVNRLKKAAADEDGIAAALIAEITSGGQKSESPLLGAPPIKSSMDPVHTRLLENLVTQQRQTNVDVGWIQEDLSHFYARTQKPEHKKLMEAMREAEIDIRLVKLRERIATNKTFASIHDAKRWAKQLREWAKEVGGGDDQNGGGGGGGGSQAEQDFEFMLKVMRMVQTEQDIRARTRSLEQLRRSLNLKKNQN